MDEPAAGTSRGRGHGLRGPDVLARGLLVEAHPRTGRKHQVRIHLADAGMPILGDRRYGGDNAAPRRA